MARERLYIFDTTMRDCQQTAGVDFAVADEMKLAAALTRWVSIMSRAAIPAPILPIRNLMNWAALKAPKLTAFGMTKRPDARQKTTRALWNPSMRHQPPHVLSPRAGTIMSMSRSAFQPRKTWFASPTVLPPLHGARQRGDD